MKSPVLELFNSIFSFVSTFFKNKTTSQSTDPLEWISLGVALIKQWEGCRLEAYWDSLGNVWTVGYGATGAAIVEGTIWTQQEANLDLTRRVRELGEEIISACSVALTTNQLVALIDFAYNEGIGALLNYTILKHIEKHQLTDAVNELILFNKAQGKTVAGLENRRLAEAELFDT